MKKLATDLYDRITAPAPHFQPTETSKTKKIRRIRCDECRQNYVEKRGDICEGCDAYREHTGGI